MRGANRHGAQGLGWLLPALCEGVAGIGQPEFAFFQGSAPAGFFSFFPGGFMSGSSKVLFGFHAVGVRLKVAPASVIEIYVDASRRDARMKQFLARAQEARA